MQYSVNKGISDFFSFTLYIAQNTHESDTTEPTK